MLLRFWAFPMFLALSAALLATLPRGQVAGAASATEPPPANYRGNPNVVCRDGLIVFKNKDGFPPVFGLEGQKNTCH